MLVRYRHRIDPTPGQRQALSRAFGCARVVYNDALRERKRAHAAGEKLSDTEVQRRVVTQAKRTPERAWLAEVASVVLVQACQDARRAHRNWVDSRSGRRKGRRVGQPRFRTNIRTWTCAGCGAVHDRDVNAARNILVAAGLAETQNACEADVRPPMRVAVGVEAGTHRGVA